MRRNCLLSRISRRRLISDSQLLLTEAGLLKSLTRPLSLPVVLPVGDQIHVRQLLSRQVPQEQQWACSETCAAGVAWKAVQGEESPVQVA